ncbi:HDIG domain-containing protein [Clostridium botulinum]|uniref:Hydrolase n=1 Tax=Clostridium botulinum B str. Osaka05 TaxID=1407017 RepID=A0A0S6U9J8_CLOBO|nr:MULTISPECIES: HDIG domain-containing metalloprotein [Clostridium]EJE7233524.1 HDIG domain-containing protein [Clostridium botulinum]EKO1912776.1 HDIG domain-containing protein [Clostridium botulinum]EKO2042837.1 HDIG domain-containing protein [Clostridium botulinum]MBO0524344.1 HDIG domain-containing protein [Clostridium botulinum]MBO0529390.1 HDIG domain-containing protein [Clostridium botulinum]
MKKITMEEIKKDNKLKRVLVFFITFLFMYVVLVTSFVTKKYDLQEGDIAKVDIKAPREIKDEISTKARLQQALEAVPIQYTKRTEAKTETLNEVNSFFSQVDSIKDKRIDEKQKVQQLDQNGKINISERELSQILNLDKAELKSLQDVLIKVISDVYENVNISDDSQKDNAQDIKKAQEYVYSKIKMSKITNSLRQLAINIAYSEIKPNFYYDKEKTEELKKETLKNTPPVMIKKDQTIVKEGEPVSKYQLDLLKDVGLLNNNNNFEWYIFIGLGVLIVLVLFIQYGYIYKFYNEVFNELNSLILISLNNCIAILLARSMYTISPFLIPLASIPMILTLLLNYKISLFTSLVNCILIAVAVNFEVEIILIAIMSAVLGSTILRKMQERNDILYASSYIAIINVILTFSAGFLLSNSVIDVSKKALFTLIGGVLSAILTIGLLPLFENLFGIVTTIKLLELSNPNNPLLKKLLLEAPGTYHHSILVGNLAEVAAEVVNGNPVLARVSAYYHDIGKTKRPYFFKENQIGKENPHGKISPNLSTLIITSHVKDGLELAKEYKIPKVIQDIIQQHHGTSLVKYFYITMKNNSERPEDVNEEDFRYPGPIPKSKEAAIIMLADGVEAAVRSINEPTKGKIEEMVNKIIKARLDEGQLDDCDLTLKEIGLIRDAFLKVLISIYHQRIEYPEDKWIKDRRIK